MRNISKKEKIIVWALTLILTAIIFLPHFIGWFNQTNTARFTYLAEPDIQDLNAYFSWIKQSTEGSWTFSDLFTTEKSSGFFHPIFLLIGKLVNLGIPMGIAWYAMRILANTILVWTLYKFLSVLLPEIKQRVWSLIIITFGGGFGWLIGNWAADAAQPEATIFQSLRWPFIFSLGISLLTLALLNAYLHIKTGKLKYSWLGGLWTLLLVFVHLYDVVVFYAVTITFIVIFFTAKKAWPSLQSYYRLIPLLLLPIVGLIYYYWLFSSDWVFLANTQFTMLGRGLLYYLLGFGTIVCFAAAGIVQQYKTTKFSLPFLFLIIWVLIQSLLILSPLSFQRKMIMGLIVPIGVLSGVGFSFLIEGLKRLAVPKLLKTVLAVVLISIFIISVPTNILIIAQDINNVSSHNFPYFIDDDMSNSLSWLDAELSDKTILASYSTSNIIPRYTGNRVVAGHFAQTINVEVKQQFIEYFFAGKMKRDLQQKFLKEHNIGYVYYGPQEKLIGPDWMKNVPDLYELTYSNPDINIYKVINE